MAKNFGGRAQRVPEVFAPDDRAGADAFVYCKGCGTQLGGHPRHMSGRTPVTVMMCDDCREKYGHDLIPPADVSTFCYRCGGKDEIFISRGQAPITYHVCPRCVPDRAARYRAGDFEEVVAPVPEPAETTETAQPQAAK
jgi:hypothetical protein